MTLLTTILESLEHCDSLDSMQDTIVALRDGLGIDHIVYHWVSADGEQYGCGTYDPEWAQRYHDRDYIRVDPVVIGCFQRFHPVDWKLLDWSSRAAKEFNTDAIAHGVGNQGYSIPIRGPNGQFALFTISHSCDDDVWAAFTETHRRDLILLAHLFNQKGLEMERSRVPEAVAPLSPREIDAMSLLAMGYSRAQVAATLSISEHTLRAYIESARFKLGAQNTTHAVVKALECGLIVVGGSAKGATGNWPGRDSLEEAGALPSA